MTEITLADAARAIRPFLPSLAGVQAADLDRQIDELLAAAEAGHNVDDQLASLLSLSALAGWTTYFFEHGAPRSWAEGRRIVTRGFASDAAGNGEPASPANLYAGGGGQDPADDQPPGPGHAYPRLDAPGQVEPGAIFTVTVGLRADADEALVSSGPMDLSAINELQVAIQFDPLAFMLADPSSVQTLQRTPQDPWPSAEFRLIALAGEHLKAGRHIDAKFLRNGQLLGFASRALVVRSPGTAAPVSADGRPGAAVTHTHTRDPAAERLDVQEYLDDEIDLLIFVQLSADVGGTRLGFTAHSRHDDIEDQTASLTAEVRGESKIGTTPQQIGQEARIKVSTTGDGEDLFGWLQGLGVRVFRSLPAEISAAARAAVAKGTAQAPARILVFSEEPHVPWELAVDPDGWPSAVQTTAPFLGAHAAISRWFLGEVPPPKRRPVPAMDVRDKALVSAHYDGIAGIMKWNGLPEAEAEVTNLAAFLAPGVAVVPPDLHKVLKLLDGTPPADLMHFALHGNFDPMGIQGGLVLLRTDGGTTTAQLLQENHVIGKKLAKEPFVYLNACQVATGSSATFGGYGGLAAAFLTAGARGVLAPLWNIQDGTASALAKEFYELSAGDERLPTAEILRRFRARYTPEAVGEGKPDANATLIAFQLFAHPGLRLFPAADRAPETSHG
jgi:CHAT domain